ncbi:MAG: hypothetical protein WBP86_08495, partial [Thiobacillaceae bacterium]
MTFAPGVIHPGSDSPHHPPKEKNAHGLPLTLQQPASLAEPRPSSYTLGVSALPQSKRKELQMTDELAVANKELLRRFYKEVYV